MPYRILEHESVGEAVRRISREQIQRAIDEVEADLGLDESVHQVRKRCKKVRAILRLVGNELATSYAAENARFRDAAKRLSTLRDSTALIETFDKLTEPLADSNGVAAFKPIREALERRRNDLMQKDLDAEARLASFRAGMVQAWADAGRWTLNTEGFDAVRTSLTKTYGRGRKALRRAYDEPSDANFHELRKSIKYHWYHMRLLQGTWKPVVRVRRQQLKKIADLLGDDHDLAVLEQTIFAESDRFDMRKAVDDFLVIVSRRRSELQSTSRSVAERLYAEEPDDLADRFEVYWQAWRQNYSTTSPVTRAAR